MGILKKMFDSRSKEDKQKDFENYSERIFPYGEVRKDKVFGILTELLPKQNQKYVRMHYILLKEQMTGEVIISFDEASSNIVKKTLIRTNPVMNNLFKTLLEVDLAIDEKLEYPNIDEIKAKH